MEELRTGEATRKLVDRKKKEEQEEFLKESLKVLMDKLQTTMEKAKELILKNVELFGWEEDKVKHHLKDVELTLITEDEQDRVHIHIIVKTGKDYRMDFEGPRNEKMYLDVGWDYIFFVDGSDVYTYPYEFLKRKDGNKWKMNKYMKDFKNAYTIINLSELGLTSYLIDKKYQNE